MSKDDFTMAGLAIARRIVERLRAELGERLSARLRNGRATGDVARINAAVERTWMETQLWGKSE